MHELGLAGTVIEAATNQARGRRVAAVSIKVGRLQRVVPDAFTLAFQLASEGTLLEGARVEIEELPAVADCRSCTATVRLEDIVPLCPTCGSADLEIRSGNELVLDELEFHSVDEGPQWEGEE